MYENSEEIIYTLVVKQSEIVAITEDIGNNADSNSEQNDIFKLLENERVKHIREILVTSKIKEEKILKS